MSIVNTQTSMNASEETYCKRVAHTFRVFGGEKVCVNCWKTPEEIEAAEGVPFTDTALEIVE